jgi:hypothetical protein
MLSTTGASASARRRSPLLGQRPLRRQRPAGAVRSHHRRRGTSGTPRLVTIERQPRPAGRVRPASGRPARLHRPSTALGDDGTGGTPSPSCIDAGLAQPRRPGNPRESTLAAAAQPNSALTHSARRAAAWRPFSRGRCQKGAGPWPTTAMTSVSSFVHSMVSASACAWVPVGQPQGQQSIGWERDRRRAGGGGRGDGADPEWRHRRIQINHHVTALVHPAQCAAPGLEVRAAGNLSTVQDHDDRAAVLSGQFLHGASISPRPRCPVPSASAAWRARVRRWVPPRRRPGCRVTPSAKTVCTPASSRA